MDITFSSWCHCFDFFAGIQREPTISPSLPGGGLLVELWWSTEEQVIFMGFWYGVKEEEERDGGRRGWRLLVAISSCKRGLGGVAWWFLVDIF